MRKRTQTGAFFLLAIYISLLLITIIWNSITKNTDLLVDWIPGLTSIMKYSLLKSILGLFVVCVVCYIAGFFKKYYTWLDSALRKIPIFGIFYRQVVGLINLLNPDNKIKKKAWFVKQSEGIYYLGYQTNDEPVIMDGIKYYPINRLLSLSASGPTEFVAENRLFEVPDIISEPMSAMVSGGANYGIQNTKKD